MKTTDNSKSKVLLILHLPPPIYGATLANELLRNSNLLNTTFSTTYINLATNTKLTTVGKFTLGKPLRFFILLTRLMRNLLTSRYNICVLTLTASGSAFYKDLLVASVVKFFRIKLIYYFHNKGVAESKNNKWQKFLYKYAFRNTKSILTSPQVYTDISSFVRSENVLICPYGIAKNPNSTLITRVYSKDGPCRLLYLGNMMTEKGVWDLVSACKILKERNHDFCCNFVGGWADISEEFFRTRIKEEGLENIVFCHGPKYGDEKFLFYSNSDIFVFPTFYHYETFGIVNLEAMQCGLPVVSTREGGIPSIVINGKTGFLISQKDVGDLADKLEILILDNNLREEMGKAGKARFEQNFTLEVFEKTMTNIIRTELQ